MGQKSWIRNSLIHRRGEAAKAARNAAKAYRDPEGPYYWACRYLADVCSDVVLVFDRALRELETKEGLGDMLHPTGYCTCAGEGSCEWCQWREGKR